MKKIWTRIGWVGSFLLLVGIGIVISKVFEESVHVHERGALVASIVEQQFHELGSGNFNPDYRQSQVALKRWVIGQVLLPSCDPVKLAQQIDSFKGSLDRHSPMRVTLGRWSHSLLDWQKEFKVGGDRVHSEDLMREGKQRYFEAAGFRKIGRAYDATILNLRTISLLTRFIHQDPYSSSVPEALFMLGAAYAGLGHALPKKMRGDRILNLCSELYPDSLWADRSQTIWREAYGDEI